MVAYLKTLDEVSDRVRVIEQGETWEKRLLLVAIVTAPENHARLEEIRQATHLLSDARSTDPGEAARIIEDQPVILWYGGSIHGNELSGAEGLMKLLEHLTTRSDAATMEVLQNAVILIDPMLNPDGRDAFANLNHQTLGREPNPLREDWSNDFSRWQGTQFRTGHYYFDTNRDWFAHTQRETQARVPTMLAWRPQVIVDAHEMGTDSGTLEALVRHFQPRLRRRLRLGWVRVHDPRDVRLLLPGLHDVDALPRCRWNALREGVEPRTGDQPFR
jgi:hypothetical protein